MRECKKLGCCASASGSRGWLGKVQRIGRSPRTHHLGEVVLKRAVGRRCRFPAAMRRYTLSSPASRDRLVPSCNSCSVYQVTPSAVGGSNPLAGLACAWACGVLPSDGTFEPCQFIRDSRRRVLTVLGRRRPPTPCPRAVARGSAGDRPRGSVAFTRGGGGVTPPLPRSSRC